MAGSTPATAETSDTLRIDTTKSAQTQNGGGNMGISDVIGSLIGAVTNVLSAIVDALKNYAAQIAELMVGGTVAYSVYRWGRDIFGGIANMIRLPW